METMTDLELVATDELIKELMSRKTFLGVLVFSLDEARQIDEVHSEGFFVAMTQTIDNCTGRKMLEKALDSVSLLCQGPEV